MKRIKRNTPRKWALPRRKLWEKTVSLSDGFLSLKFQDWVPPFLVRGNKRASESDGSKEHLSRGSGRWRSEDTLELGGKQGTQHPLSNLCSLGLGRQTAALPQPGSFLPTRKGCGALEHLPASRSLTQSPRLCSHECLGCVSGQGRASITGAWPASLCSPPSLHPLGSLVSPPHTSAQPGNPGALLTWLSLGTFLGF